MTRGDEREDERRSAVLELALPVVAVLLAVIVAGLIRGDFEVRVRSMGWWLFAVSGAGVTGLAGTCTLLWLKRRGRRVPDAIILLFASLPWLTGLGGLRFGTHLAGRALQHAEWSSHGMMAIRGYAEASASAAYGQLISMALLGATAIVLGVRSDSSRPRVFAAAVAVLAALAFVGPGMAIGDEGAVSMMLLPLVAALIALATCAGRTGAPGVALAAFLATLAGCSATVLDALFDAFEAAAGASIAQRRALFEDAAVSHGALDGAFWIAVGAIGLAALLVVGESMRRAERSRVGHSVGLLVVALLVSAPHRVATVSSMRSLDAWTRLPWQDIPGFDLVRGPDGGASEPWMVLDVDGRLTLGESELPSEQAGLRDAIIREGERRERIASEYEEEPPEWLDDQPNHGKMPRRHEPDDRYAIGARDEDVIAAREEAMRVAMFRHRFGGVEGCPVGGSPVSVAVDARAPVTGVFGVLDATHQLTIIGRRGEAIPDSLRTLAVLANAAERDLLGEFEVRAPREVCDPNPGHDVLLTTALGTEPIETLREYESAWEIAIPTGLNMLRNQQPNARFVLFVRPEGDATMQHLADLARVLEDTVPTRLVLVRELPEPPRITPLPEVIADSARDAHVEMYQARGPAGLRVLRELGQLSLDRCAQRAITLDSDLAGHFNVFARLAPDGRVESVRIAGGTAALRAVRACMADAVRDWSFPARDETRLEFRVILGDPDVFREG